MAERLVRVGLLGCGNVGAAVIRLLHEHAQEIALRAGCRLEVVRVAVRDAGRARDVPLPPEAFTTDAREVVEAADVDIVCELIGGVDPARELILRAFGAGKPVVTANKELVANHGRELFDAADDGGLDLYFEAAVAGGIPLIRPLKESLAGERIRRMLGIVNGTTNYILTQMSDHGSSFADALAEAQRLGYAEADPTADVEGHDAAAKCAILASIAFNARVVAGDVFREGISGVTPQDIADARPHGVRGEAAGDRGAAGRGHHRPRPPRHGPRRASAGERSRRLQRRVHRGRAGRAADVLRPRRRRGPHGGLRGGRPRDRGAAT